MTRIIKVPVFQGHPVPTRPHAPRGPFPPELLAKPQITTDYVPQEDSGGPAMPFGGTAQNGFNPVRYFKCRDCEAVMAEDECDDHECEDGSWPEG